MAHAPIHSLVVITLLQLCRAQSSDLSTEWFAANDINDTNYSPKPITELFSTETSFSPENPIVVLPSTSPSNREVSSPMPIQETLPTIPPNVIPLSTESPSSQTFLKTSDTQTSSTPQQFSTIPEGSSTVSPEPSSTESTLTSGNTQGVPNLNQLPRINGNIQNVRQNQPQSANAIPPQQIRQNVPYMLPPQLGNRNFIQGQPLPSNAGQPNYIVLYQQAPQNIQNGPPQMPPQIFAPPAQMVVPRPPNMVRNRPIAQPVPIQPPVPNQFFPQPNAIPRLNMAPPPSTVQSNTQFPINQQSPNQTYNNQQQVNPQPDNQPGNFQQPNNPQVNNQPFINQQQFPSNQPPNNLPNNQFPTNQPSNNLPNNQFPSNQPPNNLPNNQFPTNQPSNNLPNNQFPSNQPPNNLPNNQFPKNQPPNNLLNNQIANNFQPTPNYIPNGQPPFVPNNAQVLPPRPRQRNRGNGRRPNNRGRNRQGPNAFPCQLNQTTARPPTATQKSPVITIRLTPSRNAKPELRVDPHLSTIRPSTVQPIRQNSQINSKNFERCLNSCRDRKDRICAAPIGDTQINPDSLKGFPSMCHMACHNAFRANPIYGRVANGRCGKLRTRIQTVDKTKVRRDELKKSQYTIISNVSGTVVELAP